MSTVSAAARPAACRPARWITYCGKVKQTGKGEITYFQAISGKANFYLVQRALGAAPFDPAKPPFDRATLAAWQKFFDQVAVCDSGDPDPALPVSYLN